MKKWMIFIVVAVALMGCATSAERMEREARVAAQVSEALGNRHYTIQIQMMYPRRRGAVNVTSDFTLEVKGDTLVSYLPYFGRAYNIPYGGGNGMNFTAPIQDYQSVKVKKDLTRIMLTTENDAGPLLFEMEIYDNGSTSIWVRARERDDIQYSGEMIW